MNRLDFIELARKDVRVPIGIDMILHQYPDVDAILDHGERLIWYQKTRSFMGTSLPNALCPIP